MLYYIILLYIILYIIYLTTYIYIYVFYVYDNYLSRWLGVNVNDAAATSLQMMVCIWVRTQNCRTFQAGELSFFSQISASLDIESDQRSRGNV